MAASTVLVAATATMLDLHTKITQAIQGCYSQTARLQLTATDFLDWLDQLSLDRRVALEAHGFIEVQTERVFLHYCLEARAYSMRGYIMEHLSCAAFVLWEGQA